MILGKETTGKKSASGRTRPKCNGARILWQVYRFDFLPASRAPPLPCASEWRPEEGGGNSHYFGGERASLAIFTTSCREPIRRV
jgi:hypothetical protein